MTDIKMSEAFDLPANELDIYSAPINGNLSYIITAINAYDENQERIKTLTHENALLENQLKNAHAEISELKKKAHGY